MTADDAERALALGAPRDERSAANEVVTPGLGRPRIPLVDTHEADFLELYRHCPAHMKRRRRDIDEVAQTGGRRIGHRSSERHGNHFVSSRVEQTKKRFGEHGQLRGKS